MLTLMLVLVSLMQLSIVTSLKCYHCDVASNITCPGYDRPPIDSLETKLDIVGLFNHCVTVKLADGSIIEQNIYPGSTHCQEIFLQSWKLLLNSQWNQEVFIECCTEDLCNAPAGHTHAWSLAPSNHQSFGVSLFISLGLMYL